MSIDFREHYISQQFQTPNLMTKNMCVYIPAASRLVVSDCEMPHYKSFPQTELLEDRNLDYLIIEITLPDPTKHWCSYRPSHWVFGVHLQIGNCSQLYLLEGELPWSYPFIKGHITPKI